METLLSSQNMSMAEFAIQLRMFPLFLILLRFLQQLIQNCHLRIQLNPLSSATMTAHPARLIPKLSPSPMQPQLTRTTQPYVSLACLSISNSWQHTRCRHCGIRATILEKRGCASVSQSDTLFKAASLLCMGKFAAIARKIQEIGKLERAEPDKLELRLYRSNDVCVEHVTLQYLRTCLDGIVLKECKHRHH